MKEKKGEKPKNFEVKETTQEKKVDIPVKEPEVKMEKLKTNKNKHEETREAE